MAPIGAKLDQNAFQTIPDISFFDAENQKKCRTLNGRLPLEYGSVRPQTLGKCVSDDSQHFIFRRAEKFFLAKFFDENFRQKNFRRKIDKLHVFAELWIFGRNRQMRLEKLPPKF